MAQYSRTHYPHCAWDATYEDRTMSDAMKTAQHDGERGSRQGRHLCPLLENPRVPYRIRSYRVRMHHARIRRRVCCMQCFRKKSRGALAGQQRSERRDRPAMQVRSPICLSTEALRSHLLSLRSGRRKTGCHQRFLQSISARHNPSRIEAMMRPATYSVSAG